MSHSRGGRVGLAALLILAGAAGLSACSDGTIARGDGVEGLSARGSAGSAGGVGVPPSQFQKVAMADKQIARSELEQGYIHYFDCLRSKGIEGTITLDLDLSPSGASALGNPADTDPNDTRGPAAIDACEGEFIYPLIAVYSSQHPDSPQLLERKRALSLACIERLDPRLAERIPADAGYEKIRELMMATGGTSPAASCPDDLEIAPRDLRELRSP